MNALPDEVGQLLDQLGAPPRLLAHLQLVYEVTCLLTDQLDQVWPMLHYQPETVRLGAALHDIGKIQHPAELIGSGQDHEAAGEILLRAHGFAAEVARIARTHGQWAAEPEIDLEDLLVALADSWWRGRRDESLESVIVQRIAWQTHEEQWQVFLNLDTIAMALTADADARLAWQSQYAVDGAP